MKKSYLFLLAILTFVGSLQVSADIPTGLLRLKNRRTSTAYLTTTQSGVARGASKAASGYSQVWVCLSNGSGYTLRSAETGEYLQANFGTPSTSTATLYIQESPNAAGFYNISSDSNFGGSSCLNLGNNGTTVTKWSYANDAGSDWAIEQVTEYSLEEVKNHILGMNGFVGELSEGKYYRIISSYGRALTDAEAVGGDVTTQPIDADDIAQYWTLTKSGSNWLFENVLTQRKMNRQTTTSAPFHTILNENIEKFGTDVSFVVTRTADEWSYKWTIAAPGETRGLHDASSQGHNAVLWSTSAEASVWSFQEVELSQEAIDAARGNLSDYDEIVKQFEDIKKNKSALQKALDALFEDKGCTTLKADIAALTDEELVANESYAALTDAMKAMVLKIKNNTWTQYTSKTTGYTADYERFFRIADYQVYSNHEKMSNKDNFTMSNMFGRLSGPTGIVANKGDVIYIYVNDRPNTNCLLQLEAVETDGVAGNHPTGSQYALTQGLNLFQFNEQRMLYISYELKDAGSSRQYLLSRYSDINIHIEGGQLNGYWDATRGMTNADWKLLQQDLLKASPFLNLKTKHLVFQMDRDLVLAAEPNEMEGLMRIWDKIPENEDRYMGVEDFEGLYNNIWNVFSGASSYMHATTYGTWYTESTISTVMSYNKMRQAGNIWGPSHEIGHNHQGSINVVGTTESSNNLFSNINRFEQGIQTSRRQLPVDAFLDQSKDIPWVGRSIWQTTGMYFQLYLYFHAMHHDDNFYPNLFRKMRKNPITRSSGWDSSTEFTKDGNKVTGANITYGRLDYLHLAKMICDVAQADLSEFFEAYGMFIPVKNYYVGDYSDFLVTTTQADIDAAKKYMQKYPKKLGNLMFIDDHVGDMKDADPDNIFEGVPSANGKRINDTGQHDELENGYAIGDVGDYEDFDGHEAYDVDKDYFQISGSTVTFYGSGYMGHKFYDLDGNLIWATNAKSAKLPTKLTQLGPDKYYVVAAQQNMQDVPCPYFRRGASLVYGLNVNFGSEDNTKMWYVGTTTQLDNYLPENAVAVVSSSTGNIPENIVQATNVVNNDNTAASIVINGDKAWYLPADVTAASVTFKKDADGYAALDLPFNVTTAEIADLKTATYADDVLTVAAAESVAAGQPVVVNGSVNVTLADVALKASNYQPLTAVNVITADGQGIEPVSVATPFTYSFGEATGIRMVNGNEMATGIKGSVIHDLTGRRVSHLTHGIYIVNGKKIAVK